MPLAVRNTLNRQRTPADPTVTRAFGYLNRDGDLDLNILIRSAWLHGRELQLRAGAGLVVDSVAESELQETRAKARGLLRALGAGE